jgi:hypothetical protein
MVENAQQDVTKDQKSCLIVLCYGFVSKLEHTIQAHWR